MDMSKLSTADLEAFVAGDMARVSTAGLQYLTGGEAPRVPTPATSGFIPAVKAGWENLKGDVAGLAGRTGLMGIQEAEQYQQERRNEAEKLFTPTQDDWSESPWLKAKELAGGSAAYMAAPVVAGVAAGVAGAPALAAAGAAGLVSGAQFAGSNLTRQVEEGTPLADTNLGNALLAAAPQAALDMIGLGKIPGVRQLVGLAAKDLGKEGAEKLIGQSLQKIVADYTKATGKAMGAEGITEAGQQVLERMQAGLAINDPAARKEYWDSFVGGAVLGGALAPAGRYVERGQEQGAQKTTDLKEKQAALQAERAADAQLKQSPEYATKVVTDYKALEAQQAALQAQIVRGTLTMADKEANKAIGTQLKDLFAQNSALIKEYNRVTKAGLVPEAPAAPAAEAPAVEVPKMPDGTDIPANPYVAQRMYVQAQKDRADAVQRSSDALRAGDTQASEEAAAQAQQHAANIAALTPHLPPKEAALPVVPKLKTLQGSLPLALKAYDQALRSGDAKQIDAMRKRVVELQQQIATAQKDAQDMQNRQTDLTAQVASPEAPNPMAAFLTQFEGREQEQEELKRWQQEQGTAAEIADMEAKRMGTAVTQQGTLFGESAAPVVKGGILSGLGYQPGAVGTEGSKALQEQMSTLTPAEKPEASLSRPDTETTYPAAPTVDTLRTQLAQLPPAAQEQHAALLTQLQNNLPVVAADPTRVAQVSEWLHSLRIGQATRPVADEMGADAGRSREIAGMLNTLEAGKISETEQVLEAQGVPLTPEQKLALKGTQDRRNRVDTPAMLPTGEIQTAQQRDMFPGAGVIPSYVNEGPNLPQKEAALGKIFPTYTAFQNFVGGDTLNKMRTMAGSTVQTLSRALRMAAPIERKIELLEENVVRAQESYDKAVATGAKGSADADMARKAASERLRALGRKLSAELQPLQTQWTQARSALQTAVEHNFDVADMLYKNSVRFGTIKEDAAEAMGALVDAKKRMVDAVQQPVSKAAWDEMRAAQVALPAASSFFDTHRAALPAEVSRFLEADRFWNDKLEQSVLEEGRLREKHDNAKAALDRLAKNQQRRKSVQEEQASASAEAQYQDLKKKAAETVANRLRTEAAKPLEAANAEARNARGERDAILTPVMAAQAKRVERPALVAETQAQAEARSNEARRKMQKTEDELTGLPARDVSAEKRREWMNALEEATAAVAEGQREVDDTSLSGPQHASAVTNLYEAKREEALLRTQLEQKDAQLAALKPKMAKKEEQIARLQGIGKGGVNEPGIKPELHTSRVKALLSAKKTYARMELARDKVTGFKIKEKERAEPIAPLPTGRKLTPKEKAAAGKRGVAALAQKDDEIANALEAAQDGLEKAHNEGNARRVAMYEKDIDLLAEGKLPPRKIGPLVRPAMNVGDMRTGAENRVSAPTRSKVTQSGRRRGVTAKQAVKEGNAVAAGYDTVITPEEALRNSADALSAEREALVRKVKALNDLREKMPKGMNVDQWAAAKDSAKKDAQIARDRIVQLQEADKQLREAPPPKPAEDTQLREEAAKDREAVAKAKAAKKLSETEQEELQAELDAEMSNAGEDPFAGEQEAAGDEFAKVMTDGTGTLASAETRLALRDGDIAATADGLIASASSKEVSAFVANLKPFLEGVKIGTDANVKHNGKSVAGLYSESKNGITMHPDRLTEEDIVHEMTHAATATVFNTPDADLTPNQVAAKRGITAMWEQMRGNPAFAGEYAQESAKEFASEVYSNPLLREKMDAVGKPTSLLRRFANWVARMFGGGRTDSEKATAMVTAMLSPARMHMGGADTAAIIRNKPLDYGDAAGSALAEMADKYTARKMSVLERLKTWSALAFEQGVVDMRAAHAAAMKLGTDATVNSGKLTEQAIYDMRKSDQLMPVIQMAVMQGPPVQYTDSKGFHGIHSSGKNSLREVYEAVEALPGNAEGKMALATNYMIAQRVADVGITKAGWGEMQMDAAMLKRVMDGVDANPKLKAALENVRSLYNAYNEGLVQYLASTGAIPKALASRLLQDGSYVSMYRETDTGHAQLLLGSHVINLGEIRNQPELQALKGGDTKILPINESLLRNTSLLLSMAMKNQAGKSAAYAYQDLGAGKIKKGVGDVDPSVLHFKQEPDPKDPSDTGERWIKIETEGTVLEGVPAEMIVKALEGTNLVLPSIVRFAAAASDMLRSGVTRMPLYALRQLIRDPMISVGTAGLDGNPMSAVFKAGKEFISQTRGQSEAAARLAKKGLIQSQIFSGDSHDLDKMALQIADGNNNTNAIQKLFAVMDRASMHADAATRVLVHENALKNGLSEVQADLMTMESMNFHKRGASATIQYAHRMIPFFSSQIQGLSVLAKAARGNMPYNEQLRIKTKFYNNAVLLFASGLVYAAAMEDDEYYKNAKPRDKMSFWFVHVPGADEPIKIPIPFEYGFFFSAAVAAVEGMKEDANNEQQFAAIRGMLLNAIPGYSNAFIPQFLKPVAEVATNTNFYSWNPIETRRQEELSPEARYNKNTSELAKRIAEIAPVLSPIEIEHLVNGYFGQAPMMIAGMTNKIFAEAGAPERPAGTNNELPFFGQAFQRKYGGKDADAAYTLANKALKAKDTFDKYVAERRVDKAKEFRAEHIGEFRSAGVAQGFIKAMSELTKREANIRNSGKSPAEMQELLDRVGAQRQQMAERFHKAMQKMEATAS